MRKQPSRTWRNCHRLAGLLARLKSAIDASATVPQAVAVLTKSKMWSIGPILPGITPPLVETGSLDAV